jgi:hypothetical protein
MKPAPPATRTFLIPVDPFSTSKSIFHTFEPDLRWEMFIAQILKTNKQARYIVFLI